jgi:hypothetical protein
MSNIKLKLHEYYSLDSEINGLKNPQTGEVITEGLLAEKLGLVTKSQFIYDLFKDTHIFEKSLRHQGFLFIIPKI